MFCLSFDMYLKKKVNKVCVYIRSFKIIVFDLVYYFLVVIIGNCFLFYGEFCDKIIELKWYVGVGEE